MILLRRTCNKYYIRTISRVFCPHPAGRRTSKQNIGEKKMIIVMNDDYDASNFECTCENKHDHFICYPCLFGVGDNNE